MPQPLKITIPAPCTQEWDDMLPVGEGRHCKHCSKTVIDFTSFSDADLYTYFLKSRKVCGMFLATQLNRNIVPVQPQSKLYRMFVAMGLTLMFTQIPAVQAKIPLVNTMQAETWSDNDTGTVANLKGIVTDTAGQPIRYVIVRVLSEGKFLQNVQTDSKGFFSISLQPGKYILALRRSGYIPVQDTTITITVAAVQNMKYVMADKPFNAIFSDVNINPVQMRILGGSWAPATPSIENYISRKKIKRKK